MRLTPIDQTCNSLKMIFKLKLLVCFLFLLLSTTANAVEPVQVFVSIPPQEFLVKRIGQDHVAVKVLLKPGDSPETFDPGLKKISGLNNAQLYFRIGVAFEKKWVRSLENNSSNTKVVNCCEDIIQKKSMSLDNHVWTSPRNALLLSTRIREELIKVDPMNARDYEKNYSDLVIELQQLDDEINAQLNKRRTDYFVISHGALGHFANDYGLVQLSLETQGKEMGAKSLVNLVKHARKENIQTMFIQKQHKSAAAIAFANEIGASIIEVDPLHGDYIANLQSITNLVAKAMQ